MKVVSALCWLYQMSITVHDSWLYLKSFLVVGLWSQGRVNLFMALLSIKLPGTKRVVLLISLEVHRHNTSTSFVSFKSQRREVLVPII